MWKAREKFYIIRHLTSQFLAMYSGNNLINVSPVNTVRYQFNKDQGRAAVSILRTFSLLILGSLLSACGGGGSATSDSSPLTNKPIVLDASNVSKVAEVLRHEVFEPISLFEFHRSFFTTPVPVFNYLNITETYPCVSGERTVTVSRSGATVTYLYDQCQNDFAITIDGGITYTFSNVNPTNQTYTLKLTYDNLSFDDGVSRTVYDGTTNLDANFAPDSTVSLNILSNRSINDKDIGEIFNSRSLSFSVSYLGGPDNAALTGFSSGTIDLMNSGVVELYWLPTEERIQISGEGTQAGYIEISAGRFGVEYVDGNGNHSAMVASGIDIDNLDIFASTNSAPVFRQGTKIYFAEGSPVILNLEQWLYDPNLDVLSITPSIVSAPSGANYEVRSQQQFSVEIVADTPGEYSLDIQATDPDGLTANGVIVFEISPDTDGDGTADHVDADDDNDGVDDVNDAFPLDSTETIDSDGDGIGNNADTDDDNDGVADSTDFAPLNPLCHSVAQTDGGVCISELTVSVTEISVDGDGIIYFLAQDLKKLFRWNTATQEFLSPVQLGSVTPSDDTVQQMVYQPTQNRLYFGYFSGAIIYIDLAAAPETEQGFAALPLQVGGLSTAGNYLLAQDASGAWATHYILDSNAVITAQVDWNYYSSVYTWDPVNNRVYFFRDNTSPNDLHYEDIDQTNGTIIGSGETPYHGDYGITPPITISESGDFVLIGSGNIFNTADLTWAGAIPGNIDGAVWTAADGLIAIRTIAGETVLERRASDLTIQERVTFTGTAKTILATVNGFQVLTELNGNVSISSYTPSNDSDNDGVLNLADAFPLDPAASIDTDRDGYPDTWNPGYTQSDSTTGLTLDAYPSDAACYLPGHGDGISCDYSQVIPAFTPDVSISDSSGTIYMLSSDNNRVYRWSNTASNYLSPIVIGDPLSLNGTSPGLMTYSPEHHRLYFGYTNGDVTFVDLNNPLLQEEPFTTVATSVGGIAPAGNHILVQDSSGAWNTHYIFDQDGVLKDSADLNRRSSAYAWNSTLDRIYFFRDGSSPNDLHYEDIDPVTGIILSDGETPYHGDYTYKPPILISPDDESVLVGSGDIYDASTLTWTKSILSDFEYGIWLGSGEVITLRTLNGNTRLDHYNSSQNWQSEHDFSGLPVGIFSHNGSIIVATNNGGVLSFSQYPSL
ncbi:MAG: hypothetical protein KZQ93_09325 [Candidatus Thiodiazotropha sp. (ex Monitilora ramsayi)]|nr:hypothetical protein [Candidatus Thiodiazotropha sp. (ex Monitilora ramsayi)]